MPDLDADLKGSKCEQLDAKCGASQGGAMAQAAASMSSKDIRAFFQKRFNDLGGSDGFVSEDDLARALKMDELFTADERRVVAALKNNIDGIEELSNDEWGDEN